MYLEGISGNVVWIIIVHSASTAQTTSYIINQIFIKLYEAIILFGLLKSDRI